MTCFGSCTPWPPPLARCYSLRRRTHELQRAAVNDRDAVPALIGQVGAAFWLTRAATFRGLYALHGQAIPRTR